jgi:capsular polysaccharide biosynthesis protein
MSFDMELSVFAQNGIKYKVALAVGFAFGVFAGAVFFMLPTNFHATGSFYVDRATEDNAGAYFSYEGYYSQQTALSYTNTIAALLDSLDIKSKVLVALNISPTENNLRSLGRNVQIKKSGPQLIVIDVKSTSMDRATKVWQAYAQVLAKVNTQMNLGGDSHLSVYSISAEPVVKPEFKSLPLDLAAGGILALLLVLFGISVKEYAK